MIARTWNSYKLIFEGFYSVSSCSRTCTFLTFSRDPLTPLQRGYDDGWFIIYDTRARPKRFEA